MNVQLEAFVVALRGVLGFEGQRQQDITGPSRELVPSLIEHIENTMCCVNERALTTFAEPDEPFPLGLCAVN